MTNVSSEVLGTFTLHRNHTLDLMLKVTAVALFGFLVILPMESPAQMMLALFLLVAMWIGVTSYELKERKVIRIAILLAGAFISLRYLAWRGIYTLEAAEWVVMGLVLLLYMAEIYSTLIHLLGSAVNVSPLDRPLLHLSDLPENTVLPTVDVLIPSYNEDASLLEITMRAALHLNYPKEKLFVHLLDDGGTDQKVNSSDPETARAALARRHELRDLCRRLGVNYITRPKNEKAKAGNLNHALGYTDGELVVVFDADHVPTVDFLEHTVPWMVRHDDIFLVQTPHFMVNPDPIDRNLLRSFRRMPSESDMFYQTIQRGLDFWSSSFFCGSAAVLRREHLNLVGGLSGDSITEDAETAFELHRRGYRSVYVNRPMVGGLAPETFSAFVAQRMRWAQGMIQILLLKKPFLAPGLHWFQRLGYMSTILFWLFPFARSIFLLAPLAYLIFGAHIYHASLLQIMAYAVPHIIATYMVSTMLFGRTRWPLVSELYELMQSIFSMIALVKVFVNPRHPSFLVTPKGDTLEEDFVSPLYKPFYLMFILMIIGFAVGTHRAIEDPLSRDLTLVVLAWNLFNFVTVFAALGALFERQQQREAPRIPVNETGYLVRSDGRQTACNIADISFRGCRLAVGAEEFSRDERVTFRSRSPVMAYEVELPAIIRAVIKTPYGTELGVQFVPEEEKQLNDSVVFAYGDSRRWIHFQERRLRPLPFSRAARMVLSLTWYPVLLHLRFYTSRFKKALQAYQTKRSKQYA